MESTAYLIIPGTGDKLYPKSLVKLGKFETTLWLVMYGWFRYGGNREICGWYLINKENPSMIKPISNIDLDDIVLITSS